MEGFKNWEFMTTHCWSEKAAGDWILEICDTPSQLRNFKTPGMTLFFIWAQQFRRILAAANTALTVFQFLFAAGTSHQF